MRAPPDRQAQSVLHKAAIETANYIAEQASPAGREGDREALKDLESVEVRARLGV